MYVKLYTVYVRPESITHRKRHLSRRSMCAVAPPQLASAVRMYRSPVYVGAPNRAVSSPWGKRGVFQCTTTRNPVAVGQTEPEAVEPPWGKPTANNVRGFESRRCGASVTQGWDKGGRPERNDSSFGASGEGSCSWY
jgi:hypothetical protein